MVELTLRARRILHAIVSEYIAYKRQTYSVLGIGALLQEANAPPSDQAMLVLSVVAMVVVIVLLIRVVIRALRTLLRLGLHGGREGGVTR